MSTFLNTDTVARVAAKLVAADLGLGALVYRDVEAAFGGGSGATVKVRVPGAVAASTRAVGSTSVLTNTSLTEQAIDVSLTEEAYVSLVLNRADMTLNIEDFSKQVLAPATRGIVRHAEKAVATAINGTTADVGITYAAANPRSAVIAARKKLRDNGVSADSQLFALAGTGIYADMLDADVIDNGKVAGLPITENSRMGEGDLFVFVKEAFALAVRAPVAPEGAGFAATVQENGFAISVVQAFDGSIGHDKLILSSYLGASAMPLAVDDEAGTVTLTPGAGVVRITAA